ncbi:MAG: hypothetical protein EHM13_10705 [Acidobacteria bacterium]|nr:MAG: hypothetical protein EHM13_10705 [Acidobacteriota bacterium]
MMGRNKRTAYITMAAGLALALVTLAHCGGSDPGSASVTGPSAPDDANGPSPNPNVEVSAIVVSFKLDPRLRSGNYGGDLWVTPSTYTPGLGSGSVDAKATVLDARRQPVNIVARWTPSDPSMVTVTATQGNEVRIEVHHAGESVVQVTAEAVTKTLVIKAVQQNGLLQVAISQ